MHLNRKIVLCIDQLDQDRQFRLPVRYLQRMTAEVFGMIGENSYKRLVRISTKRFAIRISL